MDTATFLLKLSNVQSIITEANTEFGDGVDPLPKLENQSLEVAKLQTELAMQKEREKKLRQEHEEELKHTEQLHDAQN